MAYTIVNKFIPASLHKLKAPYAMDAQYITIHNTFNDATALNEIAYMTRNPAATSYHVAVDDKHAVQAIPFSRNAWHAGDGNSGQGNRKSIGIEICYSKSGGPKYVAAEENAIEYIAHVLKQYNWGVDRVMWHRNWSGKNCPHRIFEEGRADSVKKRIADKLAELKKPSTVKPAEKAPAPKPAPKPVKPVSKPKEEDDMLKQAIVIGSLNDYASAEILSIRRGIPIFPRNAIKGEVARELIVVGGNAKGLKADKITNLSGKDRFETAENVEQYL